MKFSDMMGPDDEATEQEAAVSTDTGAPPLPPLTSTAHTAPPLPESPVRFGGTRSALDEAVAGLTRVSEPDAPAEAPRAFGAPPGVPPLPPAPPVPQSTELAAPEAAPVVEAPAVDEVVEAPAAHAIVEAPPSDAIVEAPEVDSVVEAPAVDAVPDSPEADAVVDPPTGGTIALGPEIEEPPTGGSVAAEPAAEVEVVHEAEAEATPAPVTRAATSAFATIAAPAVPEVEESALAAPAVAEPTAASELGLDDEADDDRMVLHDVMAELGPRTQAFDELTASPAQLDATSWLEGLGSIDDDLLPR